MLVITGWMVPLAYRSAPSYGQAYFMSIALLSVLGAIGSATYYDEALTIYQWIGISFCIIGSMLIK